MDNLGILVQAILSLKDTTASKKQIAKELPKLESQLQSDKNTRIKIVAGLDIDKSKNLIQAQLNTLANQAKSPTIKVGIDTSSVQNTKNITAGLKEIQIQAQQTAESISQVVTNLKSQNISNDSISSFQKYFNIIGEDAKKTQQVFKDLFAELNNAWYSGDSEKYADTLNRIYSIALKTTTEIANSRFELKELTSQIRSDLTDGSKAFINPTIKSELKSILGESKEVKRVLDTVYGVGNWSYKKDIGVGADALANEAKEIQGSADDIISAYKQIQNAKSSSTISIFDKLGGEQESKREIEEKIQNILKLTNAYKDMNGVEHNYIQGLGWFEGIDDEIKDIRTETIAIEQQTKATEDLKAVRESITRDADGQQISRTSVFGNNGYTKTNHFNEDDELVSYTETNNYQKLEQQLAKIEETRAKYSRLLADFKSSNSSIQSGLIKPIEQFESVLNGLGKTSSINDVKNAFESLKQSASEITAYLDTTNSSFNKATNAVNNYKNMDNVLKEMATSFDNLVIKPENLRSELDSVKAKLIELQSLEKDEGGYTKTWAEKYREVNLELAQVKTNIELAVKSESSSQKADKNSSYQTQLKYLNKIKEETNTIISLKRKMVNAGDEEKSVYQDEIIKAQKRIQYDTQQLKKKKLLTDEAKYLVNTYKEQIALQDKINSAKTSDKNIQVQSQQLKDYIVQISKAITQLNSLQNSTTFNKNVSNPQVTQTKQEITQLLAEYQKLMTQMQGNITPAGLESIGNQLTQLNASFNSTYTSAKRFETELKNDNGAEKLAQKVSLLTSRIKAYQAANSKANKTYGSEFTEMLNQLSKPNIDNEAYNSIAKHFQIIKQEINATGKAGKTFFQTLQEKAAKFSGWMSMTYAISSFTRYVREAVVELQNVDTILTEISKTSDRTTESLKKLGDTSFATASKYGQKASDYLLGVQEMSRAGFGEKESEQMAELSTLAQSAGDMTAELANEYLIATNAGYKFGGSAEKLNAVLNSQNYITNRNALNMSELAEATKIVASQAAQSGIGIDEVTAAVGTMIATTQQGGEVAARSLKGILMNLQQVKGTAEDIGDGGEDITTESLTKYEKACADLGVSLKEVKNGVLQLRDPMVILEELANAVSKEAEGSVKVANLINAVGGKYRGNQLSALLTNWNTYSKMLSEFNSNEAVGSAFEEAMKSANSWEGKLNELSNSWTDFVNGIVNSDTAKGVIDFITNIIKDIDKLRDSIGTIPTLLSGIAAVGVFKNAGELLNTPVYAQPQLICA